MPRIKRGVAASKRRKNILSQTKGYRWRRKSNYRAAKEALMKAGKYAYRDRRVKKRTMRKLWILRLNNAVREHGLRYSTFMNTLKKKNVALDRKVLAQLAVEHAPIFAKFVEKVK
jgi:large subunit ribosomal protein L20